MSPDSLHYTLSSFRQPLRAHDAFAILHTESVMLKRLDEIFTDITEHIPQPRVYLKMDTQGWDLEVLKGASGCIGQVLALQSEVSIQAYYQDMPGYLEAIAFMHSLGFGLAGMFTVVRDTSTGLFTEMDCVMMRPHLREHSRNGALKL
jgi:hypothetical protein